MKYEFYVKSARLDHNDYKFPADIAEQFSHLRNIDQETVWIFGMNAANHCILKENIYKGSTSQSCCDPKLIFRHLLLAGCTFFVLIHNHPAGDAKPSPEDYTVTQKTTEIGEIVGIKLVDHIIISSEGFYSFAEHNALRS